LELIKYNPEELIKSFKVKDFINPIKLTYVSFNVELTELIPIQLFKFKLFYSKYLNIYQKFN